MGRAGYRGPGGMDGKSDPSQYWMIFLREPEVKGFHTRDDAEILDLLHQRDKEVFPENDIHNHEFVGSRSLDDCESEKFYPRSSPQPPQLIGKERMIPISPLKVFPVPDDR